MKSHIGLTVCQYSPGGNGFRFDPDDFLHDTYGVLDSPIDIRLISFADHTFYLL